MIPEIERMISLKIPVLLDTCVHFRSGGGADFQWLNLFSNLSQDEDDDEDDEKPKRKSSRKRPTKQVY